MSHQALISTRKEELAMSSSALRRDLTLRKGLLIISLTHLTLATEPGGDGLPRDKGLDWLHGSTVGVCDKWLVSQLVGTFTLHCRRLRGPLKGRAHTTRCALCARHISGRLRWTARPCRYPRLGSQWMSRTVDFVTLQPPPKREKSHKLYDAIAKFKKCF